MMLIIYLYKELLKMLTRKASYSHSLHRVIYTYDVFIRSSDIYVYPAAIFVLVPLHVGK